MFMKYPPNLARASRIAAPLAAVILIAACASKPAPTKVAKPPAEPRQSAPAVQSLEQYMQDAAKMAAEGNDKERARDTYRTAARLYPSSKEPWLKLAEDYFETANYGQAILSAQEVVQRDRDDSVATSILAVSGLRVSVAALSAMHDQNGKLSGGSRSEAQTLARMLRESIGETELVPQPATAAAPASAASTPAKAAVAPRPKPPVVVRRPPVAPAQAPVAAAPPPAAATPDDPFKILKK